MEEDFKNLNDEQKKAVITTDGPVLIIAGPGTGKTHTLIQRTVYLIKNKNVKPEDIMIVTFTNKAAKELLSRLSIELKKINMSLNINDLYIGTFHSICLKLIKENLIKTRLSRNFRMMEDFEQHYFVYQHYDEFKEMDENNVICSTASKWRNCDALIKYINSITEELIAPDLLASDRIDGFIGKIVSRYNQLLEEENLLDFSHILAETYYLYKNNPSILEEFQNKIKYIMVDEYQDTNYIQEQLVLLWGNQNNNICVVGDDDQSIYRFRGATVRNILEFPSHFGYGVCKGIKLVQNYRSEPSIIDFYNKWMDNCIYFEGSRFRFPKAIIPAKKHPNRNATVAKLDVVNGNYYNEIYETLMRLKRNKTVTDWNQIAFIFRSVKNDSVIYLAEYLEERGIEVFSPRSGLFFKRTEVKGLLGCLLLMFPDKFKEIHESTLMGDAFDGDIYFAECASVANVLATANRELHDYILYKARLHTNPKGDIHYNFSKLLYELIQFEPFKGYCDRDIENGMLATRPARNIGLLIRTVVSFEKTKKCYMLSHENFKYFLDEFVRFIYFKNRNGLSEYEDENDYAPSGCISFYTIHQTKGLEFPVVFIGNLFQPQESFDLILERIKENYSNRSQFEPPSSIRFFDFWRLYYTGFSRAKNLMILLANNTGRKTEPSSYFRTIFDNLIDVSNVGIEDYTFEKISSNSILEDYSFTGDVETYNECALKYKYFNEYDYPRSNNPGFDFGSLVHSMIKLINQYIIDCNKEKKEVDLKLEEIDKWFDSSCKNVELPEGIIETARKEIHGYFDFVRDKYDQLQYAEYPFSIITDKYTLDGKADLIIKVGDDYKIVDFKTEKKPVRTDDYDRINIYKQQLETYAYLLEKQMNIKASNLILYYTSDIDNPIVEFENNNVSVENTIQAFKDTVDKISDKDYNHRAQKKDKCNLCDLKYLCDKIDRF